MRFLREVTRVAAIVILVAVVVNGCIVPDRAPPTRIGSASVALGSETARIAERVAYRDSVERVGDVLLEAGRPMAPITDRQVAQAWALVERIWPERRRADLVQLSVVWDGPFGLVGVVHAAAAGGWILSIDAADLDSVELMEETIVHELVHTITLAPQRFSFGDSGACDGVRIELGCAAADSTMAGFASRFWPGGVRPASDSFVTAYAGSAAEEDLAETFTAWVFEWPAARDEAVGAKIAYLESIPELVGLRNELAGALGSAELGQPLASSPSPDSSISGRPAEMSRGDSPPSNSTPVAT